MVPYDQLLCRAEELRAQFDDAAPFPHLVLDDFLSSEAAARCRDEFPREDGWRHFTHVNERKLAISEQSDMGTFTQELIDELNSPRFIELLQGITGFEDLIADPQLMGGGLHQSERGGFLNVHADFTGHPHQPSWQRRLNLIIYLNEGWDPDWGGALELWNHDVTRCVQRVVPIFNRAVLFRTDASSFHGHPTPMTCPPHEKRRSVALYYYAERSGPFLRRSTEYRARPEDGYKSVLIYVDKMALRIYDHLKRRFRISDDTVNRVMSVVSRGRRPPKR